MRNLLGGKGANLAEMTNLGLPIPQGFTVTTEACTDYYTQGGKISDEIQEQIFEALKKVEEINGKKFGDNEDPLLVSVRSGARASMPGMMDTILNLGLNDVAVEGFAKKTGNPRFAYDSYRRFIQMFSDVVMEIPKSTFEKIIDEVKEAKGVVLTGAEYAKFHRAHKSEAIVLAKLGKKARPISSFYAGSRHAFEKLLEGTRKRGTLQYHKDRDHLMIENFMKTLDAMKFSDQSEHPVAEAVKKKMREMGTEWTLEKLRAGMRGETEMVSTMIFDSKFGRVVSRSSSLLRVFEIPIESVQWEEEDDGEEEYYE